jgi:Flp pilus assembly pilin Flp|tara:strand:- start:1231 stop:1482 length:252 start_codon:yes stop_codon:yes gene_type:complete
MLKNKKKQLGQGMTEYIIIVALIAVAAISVYNLFGQTVRTQVGDLAAELGGGDTSKKALDLGKAAQTKAAKSETLADFTQEED